MQWNTISLVVRSNPKTIFNLWVLRKGKGLTDLKVLPRFLALFACSFLFFLQSRVALGDYAWIPSYQKLWIRYGADYLSSNSNHTSDGQRATILYNSRAVDFTEWKAWVDGEFGIADGWSAYLKMAAVRAAINPTVDVNTQFPVSSGFQDFTLATKWQVMRGPVLITPEFIAVIPTYSNSGITDLEIAKGDGVVSAGTVVHFATITKSRNFLFDLSPGLMFRSSGYKPQLILEGMAEALYDPFYFRVFLNYTWSLDKDESTRLITQNSVPGSAGSFARLSLQPDLFSAGFKAGFRFYRRHRFELTLRNAMMGNRSPYFTQVGFNLFASIDFFAPEKKIKAVEVPLSSDVQPAEDVEDGD